MSMQLLAAVLIGISVFVVSQYVLKLMLEPAAQLRRTIADVSRTALFRQAKITNACFHDETAQELWTLASRLRADVYLIVFYPFVWRVRVFGLPSKDEILEACRLLNLLAYNAADPSGENRGRNATDNWKALTELGRLLHTETTYTDRTG